MRKEKVIIMIIMIIMIICYFINIYFIYIDIININICKCRCSLNTDWISIRFFSVALLLLFNNIVLDLKFTAIDITIYV